MKQSRIIFLLVVSFGLLACGTAINENRPVTGNIVFLGDSITEGYGVETSQRFTHLIEEKFKTAGFDQYTVVNQGITGDKTEDGLDRIDAVIAQKPEIVVLALGGNDFLRGTRLERVDQNLRAIITPLQEQHIEVLLAGVVAPPMKGLGYSGSAKNLYKGLAEDFGLVLMPNLLKGLVLDQRFMQSDNVHPNAAGHVLIAENLWGYLQPLLRQK